MVRMQFVAPPHGVEALFQTPKDLFRLSKKLVTKGLGRLHMPILLLPGCNLGCRVHPISRLLLLVIPLFILLEFKKRKF
jgi:hypothetical protein